MSKNMLFIDTAINTCQILYVSSGVVLYEYHSPLSKEGHAQKFFFHIRQLKKMYPDVFKTLDNIVVNIGPGRFNGLRVGIAFALTTASLYSLKLSTVTSFDIARLSFKDLIEDSKIISGTIYAKWNHIYFQCLITKEFSLKTFDEIDWSKAYAIAFPSSAPSSYSKPFLQVHHFNELFSAANFVSDLSCLEPIYLGHQIHS
jgi:tRNA A37 threonylcarbamoyladenosine modification protein TsaB